MERHARVRAAEAEGHRGAQMRGRVEWPGARHLRAADPRVGCDRVRDGCRPQRGGAGRRAPSRPDGSERGVRAAHLVGCAAGQRGRAARGAALRAGAPHGDSAHQAAAADAGRYGPHGAGARLAVDRRRKPDRPRVMRRGGLAGRRAEVRRLRVGWPRAGGARAASGEPRAHPGCGAAHAVHAVCTAPRHGQPGPPG